MKQKLLVKHSYKGKFVRAYRLTQGTFSIGSVKNARIHLMGGHTSGLTCLIVKDKKLGSWKVIDLGSESDVKLDHRAFVEHQIKSSCTLQIGENTLSIEPTQKNREVFGETAAKSGSGSVFYVARWNGHIVDTSFDKLTMNFDKNSSVEVSEYKLSRKKEIDKDKINIPPELRKPLASTFLAVFLFLILLIGIPNFKTPEAEKPKDNVYTRMIFDSKILADKKKMLQSSGSRLLKGNGGNMQTMQSNSSKTEKVENKAVASLRKAGISNIISKIAMQASKSASLVAKLAAMPSADASINGKQLDGFAQIPTTQGRSGKADTLVGAGGYKVGAVGTAGKGGGSGGYKNGSQLGNGGVGEGNIAIDDSESIVEGGLDKEVIAKVIREHLGQIRYCYDRQLASDTELHGKVKVKWDINAEGVVETQSVGESTMNNAMVEECILRRIATWKFPKPRGGTKVLVSYPFLFKSVN